MAKSKSSNKLIYGALGLAGAALVAAGAVAILVEPKETPEVKTKPGSVTCSHSYTQEATTYGDLVVGSEDPLHAAGLGNVTTTIVETFYFEGETLASVNVVTKYAPEDKGQLQNIESAAGMLALSSDEYSRVNSAEVLEGALVIDMDYLTPALRLKPKEFYEKKVGAALGLEGYYELNDREEPEFFVSNMAQYLQKDVILEELTESGFSCKSN